MITEVSLVASLAYLHVVIGVACGWQSVRTFYYLLFLAAMVPVALALDVVRLRWQATPRVLVEGLRVWIWRPR